MNYFEQILLDFLQNSKIEIEINGFDMEGFEEAIRQQLKWRLEMIERIICEDDDVMSDTEKVASVKELFQREFYIEE